MLSKLYVQLRVHDVPEAWNSARNALSVGANTVMFASGDGTTLPASACRLGSSVSLCALLVQLSHGSVHRHQHCHQQSAQGLNVTGASDVRAVLRKPRFGALDAASKNEVLHCKAVTSHIASLVQCQPIGGHQTRLDCSLP